ncbi:MAG: DoxX family protein [Xanthomonadales bacterium]|nr:DoxX family protein [Xanthomonadales bacterium]
MNILLWVLQILAAVVYGASGVMKAFLFDRITDGVAAFAALPRPVWTALGLLEIACAVGLVVPAALRWRPQLTVLAAGLLALESLVFIGVHVRFGETGAIVTSAVLGLTMAFVAYGRSALAPIR